MSLHALPRQKAAGTAETLSWMRADSWWAAVKTCLVTNKSSGDQKEIKNATERSEKCV